jgi:hypothetical protein
VQQVYETEKRSVFKERLGVAKLLNCATWVVNSVRGGRDRRERLAVGLSGFQIATDFWARFRELTEYWYAFNV